MRMMRQFLGGFAVMTLVACNLDLQNPNSPTEGQVTSSPDGVIALATGLQGRFSVSYGNYAYMAGLVTDEFASTTAALISISDAEQGSVPPGTGIAENVFNSVYRTVRTADDLLTGANSLAGQFDAGTRSGLKALAFALKAESLGEALQSYQQIPINTFGVTAQRAPLRDRTRRAGDWPRSGRERKIGQPHDAPAGAADGPGGRRPLRQDVLALRATRGWPGMTRRQSPPRISLRVRDQRRCQFSPSPHQVSISTRT